MAMKPQTGVTAILNFNVPAEKLDHDVLKYSTYVEGVRPPREPVTIPLEDLRVEYEANGGQWRDAEEQMDERGFAVRSQTSAHLGPALDTPEGVQAYNEELIEYVKKEIGASHVFVWNHVMRRNAPDSWIPVKEDLQPEPEKNLPPSRVVKATVAAAHIDQIPYQGLVTAKLTCGDDVMSRVKRASTLNLWRPLIGPVTNGPLVLLDSRSLAPEKDLWVQASVYGKGYGIVHNPEQKWSYVSHQMPDEILLIRVWDSAQGEGGKSLYAGHGAVSDIQGEEDLGLPIEPRLSVESRLVALWE